MLFETLVLKENIGNISSVTIAYFPEVMVISSGITRWAFCGVKHKLKKNTKSLIYLIDSIISSIVSVATYYLTPAIFKLGFVKWLNFKWSRLASLCKATPKLNN